MGETQHCLVSLFLFLVVSILSLFLPPLSGVGKKKNGLVAKLHLPRHPFPSFFPLFYPCEREEMITFFFTSLSFFFLSPPPPTSSVYGYRNKFLSSLPPPLLQRERWKKSRK